MKSSKKIQNKDPDMCVRRVFHGGLTAVAVALFSVTMGSSRCLAQEGDYDVKGTEILTRGPVHEAFAGIVTFNPVPGVVVQKAPPEAIEEIPPGERPEGNNITWIPGYWAWDDERSDYLWVSGTWRALPPGRQWMAGYWGNNTQGHQWTSGYWADATVQETTYLPAPPATVEDGPNTKAPSRDYGWTPGNWMWRQERYAWSPGYWARGRADWDWIPAHYVWTPRGYIYVDGYWDYSVRRRGTLFAPVYFDSGVYSHSGYSYSPSIALDLAIFAEHLFLRPKYNHYYFGDYYAPRYNQGGIFAAFTYQSNRHGYDPIYSHQRWTHREDRGWDQRAQENYRYRSDHENARPPHTWNAMRKLDANTAEYKQHGMMVAAPIDQLAKRKDGPVRFQSVAKEDRNMLAQRGQEMRKNRNERRTLEARGDDEKSIQKAGEDSTVTKVKLPRSQIVARSADQFKKGQAPPEAQRSPKIESLDSQPKSETSGRQPKMDKNNPKPEARKNETEIAPRDKQAQPDRPKKGGEQQAQPTNEGHAKEASEKAKEQPTRRQEQPERSPQKVEKKEQPAFERRTREAPEKAQEQPTRRQEQPERTPQKVEKKEQPAPERRAKEVPARVQEQPSRRQEQRERSSQKIEKKEQPAPERRAREAPARVQEQPTRKEPEKAPQRETQPNTKKESSSNSNESDQTDKKDRKKD